MASELERHVVQGELHTESYFEAVADAKAKDWPSLLRLTGHPQSHVRLALIATLPMLTDRPPAEWVSAVATLAGDLDEAVREQACSLLAGPWREVDDPCVRDSLISRLQDPSREVRAEAMLGLALRQDDRALPYVRAALSDSTRDTHRSEYIAAGALGSPELHPLVLGVDALDIEDPVTVEAVRRLTDPDGVGIDLVLGVADLYRSYAHGRSEPELAQTAWEVMARILEIQPQRAPAFLAAVAVRLQDDGLALQELTERSALAALCEVGHRTSDPCPAEGNMPLRT